MNRPRAASYLACFILLFAVLGGLMGGSVVFAAEEGSNSSDSSLSEHKNHPPPRPPEPIEFDCAFPIIEGSADEMFKYEIYTTPAAKEFAGVYDINVISPPGWEATVWVGRGDKQRRVGAVDYGGRKSSEHHLTVAVKPLQGKIPESGEYAITLEMESGPYKGSYYLPIMSLICIPTPGGLIPRQGAVRRNIYPSCWKTQAQQLSITSSYHQLSLKAGT